KQHDVPVPSGSAAIARRERHAAVTPSTVAGAAIHRAAISCSTVPRTAEGSVRRALEQDDPPPVLEPGAVPALADRLEYAVQRLRAVAPRAVQLAREREAVSARRHLAAKALRAAELLECDAAVGPAHDARK